MLIYICCAGGATSSMFCQKIQEAVDGSVLIDYISSILDDFEEKLKTYDMILAYGPASFLSPSYMIEYELHKKISSVWIAPQVRFMRDQISELLKEYEIPVRVIDMHTFGVMDGKKAYQEILSCSK